MLSRNGILVALGAIGLAACHPTSDRNADDIADIFPLAVIGERGENKHNHPEYCVIATDDASVGSPELARMLFDGKSFDRGAYHAFGGEPLIIPYTFRIGHLPDGILETGLRDGSYQMLSDICTRDYRAALIFTGPRFAKQVKEAFRFLPKHVRDYNGHEGEYRTTKAGGIVDIPLMQGDTARVFVHTR